MRYTFTSFTNRRYNEWNSRRFKGTRRYSSNRQYNGRLNSRRYQTRNAMDRQPRRRKGRAYSNKRPKWTEGRRTRLRVTVYGAMRYRFTQTRNKPFTRRRRLGRASRCNSYHASRRNSRISSTTQPRGIRQVTIQIRNKEQRRASRPYRCANPSGNTDNRCYKGGMNGHLPCQFTRHHRNRHPARSSRDSYNARCQTSLSTLSTLLTLLRPPAVSK